MKSNFVKSLVLLVIVSIHIFLLLKSSIYITPELIFPVWLISNAKIFVSETQSMYAPLLFYIVSFLYKITQDFLVSINLIQLTLVVIIDFLLFYYLLKKFNFKLAIAGLFFYMPWQVFFRGNYLWFDLATIPFIIISFIFFEKFVTNFKLQNLILASVFLSLGYFFKSTVFWIYGLYFVWIVVIAIKRKSKFKVFFKYLLRLLSPLVVALFLNFLIVLSKGTLDFSFYWNIIMQIFIYPRMPTLARPISPNYYPVMALIFVILLVSFAVIKKYSKKPKHQVWFLFTFALISLANIFPRWSDFHVQPFLPFLTLVLIYAVSLNRNLKYPLKLYYRSTIVVALLSSLLIFGNRIITEINNSKLVRPDYVKEFAPKNLNGLIKDRNIFFYDQPLYNREPITSEKKLDVLQKIILGFKNPDTFYRITSWQKATDYVKDRDPDLIIIPYQIENRILAKNDLSALERLISENYHRQIIVGQTYFLYLSN